MINVLLFLEWAKLPFENYSDLLLLLFRVCMHVHVQNRMCQQYNSITLGVNGSYRVQETFTELELYSKKKYAKWLNVR